MNKTFFAHQSAIIEEPSQIGEGTKIWHFSHIMSNCQIGKNCIIGQNVFIASGVIIGDNVKIQNNVSLYSGVICENDVFIGPSAVFTNVINPRSFIERKHEFKKTILKKGASIGANSTIICGNEIGEYSLVGAGSVITKNVNNFSLVVGNPAKHIGWISKHGSRLVFTNNQAVCSQSGQGYRLINANQIEKEG